MTAAVIILIFWCLSLSSQIEKLTKRVTELEAEKD